MFVNIKKKLKQNKLTRLPFRLLSLIKNKGVLKTLRKLKQFYRKRFLKSKFYKYNKISQSEIKKQQEFSRTSNLEISIVVPVYNTEANYLKDMVESVLNQTYQKWQLCIADGSDEAHDYVGKVIRNYSQLDKRIAYKKLEENKGISQNTNACLEMADGDYIALLDHDDILDRTALYEVAMTALETGADLIYTDENTFSSVPQRAYLPAFKPDFSPDTLRSYNYICHFLSFSKELLNKAGSFCSEYDGSQDYDLLLRLSEKSKKTAHIPKILYYWRAHKKSVAGGVDAKPYALKAAKMALSEHLERLGLKGEVYDGEVPSTYHIQYEIDGNPLVTIIIPNKDHIKDLELCLTSIKNKTRYSNYEVIVVENNSSEQSTFDYYNRIENEMGVEVLYWKGDFNFSEINNFAVKAVQGEYIIFLNNDIEIISENWIQEMLMFCQRKDVGAVGAKLLYPDGTVQHAGVILGLGGVAGHAHKYFDNSDTGYAYRLVVSQNLSAVTAACMMISKQVFDDIGGFDPQFQVAFNDIDLCMKIREKGYLIVFTPFAQMYHYESKSRGAEDTEEKIVRFQNETKLFRQRWEEELKNGDPYYNKNLTLDREDFSFA